MKKLEDEDDEEKGNQEHKQYLINDTYYINMTYIILRSFQLFLFVYKEERKTHTTTIN